MRPSEARWIGNQLGELPVEQISPLLELGSSTLHFRTLVQPHIDREIYAPLRRRGAHVIHSDLIEAEGVDVNGDIYDPKIQQRLERVGARCLLCCNIFEHVSNRPAFARICDRLLMPKGYVVVTVPYSYPYHCDPIDTMYRPDPIQIVKLLPDYELVKAAIVTDTTFGQDLVRRLGWRGMPLFGLKAGFSLFVPFRGIEVWKSRNHRLLWLFRHYKQSCVVLRKPGPRE